MNPRIALAAALCLSAALPAARAGFHFIEVEQVVGGINGDNTALAIQLRLRSAGQTLFGSTPVQLRIWDSTGTNSSVIGTISSNFGSGTSGSRILFANSSFVTQMSSVSGFTPNFTLSSAPFSFLSGGKVTFETVSGGTVIWALAYGNYTGTNTGSTFNDLDGNFGAPFGSALPTDGRGIIFKNGLSASTTNSADYMLTTGAAVLTNNAGTNFTVVPEPNVGLLLAGGLTLGGVAFARRRRVSRE